MNWIRIQHFLILVRKVKIRGCQHGSPCLFISLFNSAIHG